MQRRVQRTQKSQSQPKAKTEKIVREVGPRREEVIQTTKRRNEYIDNFSYHETKDLKRNNPRYFVVVEHTRKGEIFLEVETSKKLVMKDKSTLKVETDPN